MPSKRVIVLDQLPGPRIAYRVAMWADVPAGRQSFYANAIAASAWTGATGAENTALQNGSVTERVETYSVDGTPTLASVKAALAARWTAFQAEITAFNPWNRWGTFLSADGSTWTDTGVS